MFPFEHFRYLVRKIRRIMHLARGSRRSQKIPNPQPSSSGFMPPPVISGYPVGYFPNMVPQWDYQQQNTWGWQGQQYPHPHHHRNPSALMPSYNPSQRPIVVPPSQPPPPHYPQTQNHVPATINPNQSQSQLHPSHSHPRNTTYSRRRPSSPGIRLFNRSSEAVNRASEDEDSDGASINRHPQRRTTPAPTHFRRVSSARREQVATSYRSPPPPITYGLLTELASTVSSYPSIDWNITHRPHKAVMLMRGGRTSKLDLDKKAITPGVDLVYITTKASSPLQLVMSRWGPIVIKTIEKPSNPFPYGFDLGDVLSNIYEYFITPLTKEEIRGIADETHAAIVNSRDNRWNAAKHVNWNEEDKEVLSDDIHRGPSRADLLHGYLHYAGLRMFSDFPDTKTLYLTLENPALVRP